MNTIITPSGKQVKTTSVYNNFKYRLEETPKTLRLVEIFIGDDVVIGEVRDWKRHLLQKVDDYYSDKDEREKGYRLFLAIKVLNKLNQPQVTYRYLQVMKELTLEEAIFWVWQYHSYKEKALNAFNCIYLNKY